MAKLLQRLRRHGTLGVNRTKNCPSCLVRIFSFPTGNLCQSIRTLFKFVRVCFPPALLTPECHLSSSNLVTATRCHRPSQGTQQSTNTPWLWNRDTQLTTANYCIFCALFPLGHTQCPLLKTSSCKCLHFFHA